MTAGSAAVPAKDLSQWSYSLLPDGIEVEDTIPEWLGGASESTYRGVWVSRSRPYRKKVAAQLGLGVAVFPAGILLLATFRTFGLPGALGVCAATYLVFAIPIWASLRVSWGRDLRGTCDLYAPEGMDRQAFKALLDQAFGNARMPVRQVKRRESSFEEWRLSGGLSFTFWNASGTTPDRAEIAWTRRADAAHFRILKGMMLAALRSAASPPETAAATAGQNLLGQARAV